jgi:hypothetical protein
MKRIKSSVMKRKKRNMIAIGKGDLDDSMEEVLVVAKADSEVSEILISEILILVI